MENKIKWEMERNKYFVTHTAKIHTEEKFFTAIIQLPLTPMVDGECSLYEGAPEYDECLYFNFPTNLEEDKKFLLRLVKNCMYYK